MILISVDEIAFEVNFPRNEHKRRCKKYFRVYFPLLPQCLLPRSMYGVVIPSVQRFLNWHYSAIDNCLRLWPCSHRWTCSPEKKTDTAFFVIKGWRNVTIWELVLGPHLLNQREIKILQFYKYFSVSHHLWTVAAIIKRLWLLLQLHIRPENCISW